MSSNHGESPPMAPWRSTASSLNRAGDVVWSPNGKKISFLLCTSTSAGTEREGIATANIDGTEVHWVTDSPSFDHEADWGPR